MQGENLSKSIYASNKRNGPPDSAQGLFGANHKHSHAIFTLQMSPPTSPCLILCTHADLSPRDIARIDIMKSYEF